MKRNFICMVRYGLYLIDRDCKPTWQTCCMYLQSPWLMCSIYSVFTRMQTLQSTRIACCVVQMHNVQLQDCVFAFIFIFHIFLVENTLKMTKELLCTGTIVVVETFILKMDCVQFFPLFFRLWVNIVKRMTHFKNRRKKAKKK